MTEITLDGVTRRWGETVAVRDVRLRLPSGRITALVGPSGGGKTTLLMLIAGLLRPHEGRILFDGDDMRGAAPRVRDIGFVFQNYALYPHMNVRRNIAYPLKFLKLTRAETERRIEEIAAAVNVETLLDRRPDALSGGQRQRVALARALVKRPRILLMDEPLANADAPKRIALRALIRDIQRRFALTGVIATHDQSEALALADNIACISDGGLIQFGPPADLIKAPANTTVAKFFSWPEINILPVEMKNGDAMSGGGVLARAAIRDGPALIGLRPEHLRIAEDGAPGALAGVVTDVQPLAREVIITVKTGAGRLRIAAPGRDLETRRPGPVEPGTRLSVLIDDALALYFDPQNLARISPYTVDT